MAGEGEVLKKAREEKGWSLQDVEDAIKIRVRYLQALENEEYSILPGATYTKGFLRTYSRHLGLDPEKIIEYYNLSLAKEPEVKDKAPLTPIQNTTIWFKPAVIVVMAILAISIVLGITYISRLNSTPPASDYKVSPLPSAPADNNPSDNTPNNTVPQGEEPPLNPQPGEPQQYSGITAEITFKEDCWLVVRSDGVIVEEGMNAAGTTKTLQSKEKMEFLTIGNAGGIALKLNGKEIGPLGVSKQVVRNYVVTLDTIRDLDKTPLQPTQ